MTSGFQEWERSSPTMYHRLFTRTKPGAWAWTTSPSSVFHNRPFSMHTQLWVIRSFCAQMFEAINDNSKMPMMFVLVIIINVRRVVRKCVRSFRMGETSICTYPSLRMTFYQIRGLRPVNGISPRILLSILSTRPEMLVVGWGDVILRSTSIYRHSGSACRVGY